MGAAEGDLRGRQTNDFGKFSLGAIEIDGVRYEHDLVVHRGGIRKRKNLSKKSRADFGHTPIFVAEPMLWKLPTPRSQSACNLYALPIKEARTISD